MKRVLTICLVLAGVPALAQSSGTLASQDLLMLVVLAVVLLVAILVLIVAIYLVVVIRTILAKEGAIQSEKEGAAEKVKAPGFWAKINSSLTDAVPVEKEEEILLDHNYDGIQELDNHLPPWWKWLFYATIFLGVIYLFVYHVMDSDYFLLMEDEYALEMKEAEETQATLASSGAVETIDIDNPEISDDPAIISSGQSVFLTNCASCHAQDGGGGIGPNLTDAYWMHGGEFKDVFKTIYNGIDGTSMIAWKNVLTPVQVRDVSSYISVMVGTTPANPKEPQGDFFEQKAKEQPADSTILTQVKTDL